ncbi:MAG: HD-GYP domain-containing protein [Gammaproteobacteria bacterium]|nr:HD-GYP domain-containing protein [Gammaproteobacteria bacterium]
MKKTTLDTQLIKHKISVEQLVLGMYVTELDRPWLESPFLFQGFFLTTDKHIAQVQEVCNFVYIDTTRVIEKEVQFLQEEKRKEIVYPAPPKKIRTFIQEISRADRIFSKTSRLIQGFLKSVDVNQNLDIEEAKEAVDHVVHSVIKTPDALMWLTQLKNRDEYTSQHSMNVCVLSVALGRHIGLSEKELKDLGLCGMLHDMGKMLIPNKILNKPGKLEGKEIKIMKYHTVLGLKILKKSKGRVPLSVINVAYSHHERVDGKGYPRGIGQDKLTRATRIVAITDMYDALTSDRVYRKGCSHLEAIDIMTKMSGKHLDYALVLKFIECLSVYPPGSTVQLTNDEIAIVVEVNQDEKLRPKIILLLGADKKPKKEKLIDLSKREEDVGGEMYTIKRTVRPIDYGIDIMKFYNSGVIQKGFSSL